jgi:hypothetical protein
MSTIALKPAEIKIMHPPDFDGDRDKTECFLIACKVYLDFNNQTYTTDKSKIIFVTLFINEGNTESWSQGFLKSAQDPNNKTTAGVAVGYRTWAEFLKEFNENFTELAGLGGFRGRDPWFIMRTSGMIDGKLVDERLTLIRPVTVVC